MAIAGRVLHGIAIIALAWLLPWNIRFYQAAYFADPRTAIEVYGQISEIVASPVGSRLSIRIDGDRITRWDLFLDRENGAHLISHFRPEEPVRLAGYRSVNNKHLAVQMESKSYALDSDALTEKSNLIRLFGLLLNGWIVALLLYRISRTRTRNRKRSVTDSK